jgi:plastocyanin
MALKNSVQLVGILVALVMVVFLSGCAQSGTPDGGNNTLPPNTVEIQNFAFNPSELSVPVGTTVTWINKDSATHTVKFNDSISPDLTSGATFQRTFSEKGTFDYSCSIHPSMKGKIIVQ